MKFYVIAGEASGDLHASNLVKELKRQHADSTFRGLGGDLMMKEDVTLLRHYRETAFMGFLEVIKNLRKILGFIDECKKDILTWQPDAVILVDYPGFNLRIAGFAKKHGFKVFYYISPQVWAWKSSRVHKIRRDVDRMLVILPFEKDFYKQWNYEVDFVGHPLLDAVKDFIPQKLALKNNPEGKPIIALLPGSREMEIANMLPQMLQVTEAFPAYHFVVAGLSAVPESFYWKIIGKKKCDLIFNQTYSLLSTARAALVTSGTATLETAIFNVPQVVCYKGNKISFWIAKRLVNVKYISLVNLVEEKPLLEELVQDDLSRRNLERALKNILDNEKSRTEILTGYRELKEKLGGSGASAKAAAVILKDMHQQA